MHFLAADFKALGIELINCQTHAVLVVLAEMSLRAGERRSVANLYQQGAICRGGRRSGFVALFFAAAGQADGGGQDRQREYIFHGLCEFHGNPFVCPGKNWQGLLPARLWDA